MSSRVWWEAATNTTARSWRAFFCVLWWGALDRLWLRAARFGRVCSTTGYITSGLRGPSPQALTLFGGVGFIARRLRRPEKGNADEGPRHFWNCLSRLGFGPATGPTLKTALCHIRTLVGRRINTARSWRAPRGLFWTSVRSVALEKEQWQTWGL